MKSVNGPCEVPGDREAKMLKDSSSVVGVILAICHGLTFLPLFIIIALQDVHLKLAVVLNTALCICLTVGNCCFHSMGVIKVYPKMLDTFLLVLYASLTSVAYTHYHWLFRWVSVLHHAAVASFMWLSIILPCFDNFIMENVKDRLVPDQYKLHATRRNALHAAQAWAGALTISALVSLGPSLTDRVHPQGGLHIGCNYVVPLVLLLTAAILQRWLLKYGLPRSRQQHHMPYDAELGLAAALAAAGAASASGTSSDSNVSSGSIMQDSSAQLQDPAMVTSSMSRVEGAFVAPARRV